MTTFLMLVAIGVLTAGFVQGVHQWWRERMVPEPEERIRRLESRVLWLEQRVEDLGMRVRAAESRDDR